QHDRDRQGDRHRLGGEELPDLGTDHPARGQQPRVRQHSVRQHSAVHAATSWFCGFCPTSSKNRLSRSSSCRESSRMVTPAAAAATPTASAVADLTSTVVASTRRTRRPAVTSTY